MSLLSCGRGAAKLWPVGVTDKEEGVLFRREDVEPGGIVQITIRTFQYPLELDHLLHVSDGRQTARR